MYLFTQGYPNIRNYKKKNGHACLYLNKNDPHHPLIPNHTTHNVAVFVL